MEHARDGQGRERVRLASFVREQYWPLISATIAATGQSRESAIVRGLTDRLGTRQLADLGIADLDQWWASLRATVAPGTCNRHLTRVKHLFGTACRWGLIAPPGPCAGIRKLREPRGRVKWLTDDQRAKLLAVAPPALKVYIYACRFTGGRRGSLWALRRKDLDLDSGFVTFPKTKNGDSHTIPVTDGLLAALGPLPDDPEAFLLPRMRPESVSRMFRKAASRAGLVDFHFHDLRHDLASHLAMAGKNQRLIMDVLGHRDPRMSLRYTHVSADVVRRALDG